jgi:hypothetical protein
MESVAKDRGGYSGYYDKLVSATLRRRRFDHVVALYILCKGCIVAKKGDLDGEDKKRLGWLDWIPSELEFNLPIIDKTWWRTAFEKDEELPETIEETEVWKEFQADTTEREKLTQLFEKMKTGDVPLKLVVEMHDILRSMLGKFTHGQ